MVTTVNDVELAGDRAGPDDGRELVLCHGFTGSRHDFALSVPTLSANRPVLTVDHRGHGESTKTGHLDGYTIAQLVDDFVAWLEVVAHPPVDLLGHSMGGRVVLGVTLARPDLVHSLILMDTTSGSFGPDDLVGVFRSHFAEFDPAIGARPDLPSDEQVLIEARTPADWQARKAVMDAAVDPYAYKGLGVDLFDVRTEVDGRLGEIACPTTVLAGSKDHPLVDHADAMAEGVANGRAVTIDGAYHSPQLTHRAEWEQALADHLAWAGS